MRPSGRVSLEDAARGRSRRAGETVGRPPRYCDLPEHTAQTAFRKRRRRAAAGEFDGDEDRAGPLIAGAIIALWSTTAAVATTAVLSFVGAVAFGTAQKATKPELKPAHGGRLPALAGGGIRTVVATSAAFGLTFGVLDVAFPAFARTHGSAAAAGVLLSAFAVGSRVGGFLYGLRPTDRPAGQQYPLLCLLAGLGLAPLILTPSLLAMVPLAALSGLCFAPITTCQMAVIDEVAERQHKAEAFTWLGTLYGTDLAIGAALSGQLIATIGTRAAIAAACGATLLTWLLTTARVATLQRSSKPTESTPTTTVSNDA